MIRLYTPDTTGRCTVCLLPRREHALPEAYGEPRACPPADPTANHCEADAAAAANGSAVNGLLTPETVTNKQIEALREVLPRNHYAWQSTIDALVPSQSHQRRQRNARALCAEIINARSAVVRAKEIINARSAVVRAKEIINAQPAIGHAKDDSRG